MKKFIDFSLNNKFAIWILTVIVIVTGLYSGLHMKQEMMPNINLPNLSVITTYPGAAPDEVAENVTVPIEQRIRNLEGVEQVSSSSLANASSIQIEFDFETDMDKAENEVNKALENVELPENATDPDIMRLSLDAFPVLSISVSDTEHSLEELTTILEKNVIPGLEGIDGLSEVQIAGQQMHEVTIAFDDEALAEYDLTINTIEQIIQASDITFPLGLTNIDDEEKNLLIDGNIATIDDLKALEIPFTPQLPEGMDPEAMIGDQENPMDLVDGQDEDDQAQESMTIPTIPLSDLATIELDSKAESISRTKIGRAHV